MGGTPLSVGFVTIPHEHEFWKAKGNAAPGDLPTEVNTKASALRDMAYTDIIIADDKRPDFLKAIADYAQVHVGAAYTAGHSEGVAAGKLAGEGTTEEDDSPKSKNKEEKNITDSRAFWAVMGVLGGAAIAALVAWLVARNMEHHLRAQIQQLKQAALSGNGQ
jgi:hypothetical protein